MRFKNTSKIIFMRKNWNFDDSEYGGKKKIKIKKKRKEKKMKWKEYVDWRIIRIIIEVEK